MTENSPSDTPSPSDTAAPADSRRSFVTKMVAIVTGGIGLLVPLVSGLVVFLSPLWRKTSSPKVRVALLSQVPEDGMPRYFPVRADRNDAWNHYPQQRIGAVYLLREKGQRPIAFAAKCPHAGCFIGYTSGSDVFQCPCHTSAFHLDGTRMKGDAEVSPRDMDRLPVELKPIGRTVSDEMASLDVAQDGPTSEPLIQSSPESNLAEDPSSQDEVEIWVEYIEFQTGHKQQIRAV